jgi:hypothetical protein
VELTWAQKEELYAQGFVQVRGVVPRVMVDAALKAINESLGRGIDPEKVPEFRARTFCPELVADQVITQLLTDTPAWSLAESVLGPGQIRPVRSGQIALRFPVHQDPPPPPQPHLDGMHAPLNGVPPGVIRNFTMLVGVLLSDVTGPYAGNLAVWPGSHRLYEAYFREHGPEKLLEGMPPVPLPDPVQLTGQAGDVVLCHYQLAHGITPNVSPHIRYAVYFRLTHVSHDDWREPMVDIWREWPGMADVLARSGTS